MKKQPLNKTVQTEFTITLADLQRRQFINTGSISATVNIFNSGDLSIDLNHIHILKNITKCVILSSFQPFAIKQKNDFNEFSIQCDGLFIFYGRLDELTIMPNTGATEALRIQYFFA